MSDGVKKMQKRMIKKQIRKQLLICFFPIVIGTFFLQLYSFSDTLTAGRMIGSEALAAAGSSNYLSNLFISFFNGLCSGVMVAVSRYLGSGRHDQAGRASAAGIILAAGLGLTLTVLTVALTPQLLRAIAVPEDILPAAVLYTRIYFTGLTGMLIYNTGSAALRASGDFRSPMFILIFTSLFHLVLAVILEYLLGPSLAWIALATAAAQWISGIWVLLLLRADGLHRSFFIVRHDLFGYIREILSIGLPAGLQTIVFSLSNLLIQSKINTFGTDTIAAWTVYAKTDSIYWMCSEAIGISAMTCASYYRGSGEKEKADEVLFSSLKIALFIALGFTLLFQTGARMFCGWFTDNSAVLKESTRLLRFMSAGYVLYFAIDPLSGSLRADGRSAGPTVISIITSCLLRILWIILISPENIGGLLPCYPASWLAASLAMALYSFRRLLRHDVTAVRSAN